MNRTDPIIGLLGGCEYRPTNRPLRMVWPLTPRAQVSPVQYAASIEAYVPQPRGLLAALWRWITAS